MAQFPKSFVQDLDQDLVIRKCGTIVFNTDNLSNVITVELFHGAEPAQVSGSVLGAVVQPNGDTVPITNGAISGNAVSITLTADCFTQIGPIGIGIQVITGERKTTVFKAYYWVEQLTTDAVVDPGSRITLNVADLVQRIDAALASIPADYSALLSSIAPDYTELAFPVSAGQFTWYNGSLYQAAENIPSSETWTPGHWRSAVIADELKAVNDKYEAEVSNLKSAINLVEITNQTPGLTVDKQKYVNRNTGEIESNTSRYPNAVSGIPVEGDAFVFKIASCEVAGARGIAFYDGNGDFIPESGKAYTVGETTYFFTIPAEAVTMAVTTFGVDNVFSIRFVYFQETDKTLTEIDAPADGKATGDAISAVSAAKLDSSVFTEFYNDKAFIYRGGLTEGTDLNTLVDNGWHAFGSAVRSTLVNLPEDATSGTGALLVLRGTGSGRGVSTQILINDAPTGRKIYERLMNYSTKQPINNYNWVQITKSFADATGDSTAMGMTQKAITDAINAVSAKKGLASVWAGKTIVCFGDSRTWYDGHAYNDRTKAEWTGKTCVGYQQQLRDVLGCMVISEGVSGNTSVQICERILAYDFTGADAAFLEGGVNDFVKASSVTIGAIAPIGSTFDTSTVYGAWQAAVEYILTNYPSTQIYMDIPAIAWVNDNVFPYNTAKIKGEIAELYNLPCLDLYKNGGINVLNRDYWYCDDVSETGWRLHFNDYGNAMLGKKIAGFLATH